MNYTQSRSTPSRSAPPKPTPVRLDLTLDAIYLTARAPTDQLPNLGPEETVDIVLNTPWGPRFFIVKPKIRDGWATFVVPPTVEEGRELLAEISGSKTP